MIFTRKLIHVTFQNLQVRNTEASSSTTRFLLQNNKAPVMVTNDGPCISGLGTFIQYGWKELDALLENKKLICTEITKERR